MSKFSNKIVPANRVPRWPFTINRQSDQARGLAVWLPFATGLSDMAGPLRSLTPSSGSVIDPAPTISSAALTCTVSGAGYYSLSDIAGLNLNVPLTISMWLRRIGAETGGVAAILSDSAAWNDASYIDVSTYVPRVVSAASVSFGVATGTTVLQENTYYLLTGVWESATSRKIYVNGFLEGSDTTNLAGGAPELFRLGADWSGGNALDCALADVRVLTRALSASEVWALYDPATRYELYQSYGRRSYFFAPSAGGTPLEISCRIGGSAHAAAYGGAVREASAKIGSAAHSKASGAVARLVSSTINSFAHSSASARVARNAQMRIGSPAHIAAHAGVCRGASVKVDSRASIADRITAVRQMAMAVNSRSSWGEYTFVVITVPSNRMYRVPVENRIYRVPAENRIFRV